jgi:hypothetical protein
MKNLIYTVNRQVVKTYTYKMLKKTLTCLSVAKQYHGFLYEQKVIQKYNLRKAKSYTSPCDAHHGMLDVQIKCMQHGTSVEFGDYLRNKHKTTNFILIVGFWKNEKDNIIQEHIFDVDVQAFTNNLYYPYDEKMYQEMSLITNMYEDDGKWKAFCQNHRAQWHEFQNNMDLRFRRDHKKQKRIQCGVSWKKYHSWFMDDMKKYTHDDFCHMLQL